MEAIIIPIIAMTLLSVAVWLMVRKIRTTIINNVEKKFDDILTELLSEAGSYKVYEPDHRNVWVETTFDDFKSFIINMCRAGEWHAYFEYKIDESTKSIYFMQPQSGRLWGKTKWSDIEHQSERDKKDAVVAENIRKYYESKKPEPFKT